MNLQKNIRRILREVFDSKSTFKRNVYGGEEEYREVTKNRTVIWNPEYKIAFQYIFDDREVPGYTFVHLYPYTEGRYNYQWEELDNSVKSKIFIDAIKKLPKVLKNYFKKFGKLDKVVFRPKTGQMGNIYSSPSVIRILQSEFGTDYNIEVNQEDKKSLPVNTVIMTLKNIVKESEDDFNWIRETNPNPLESYFAKGYYDVGMIFKSLKEGRDLVNKLRSLNYSWGVNIDDDFDPFSFGDFDNTESGIIWSNKDGGLQYSTMGYKPSEDEIIIDNPFNTTSVNESEDDFDWIKDVNPSLLDSIIIFEPMITEEEYGKVLEVLELDENIHTHTGHINTLNPFGGYDYLHHLLINVNGRTVYGGANYTDDEEYDDLNHNINDYVSTFSNLFPNPTRIDGRKYFNL